MTGNLCNFTTSDKARSIFAGHDTLQLRNFSQHVPRREHSLRGRHHRRHQDHRSNPSKHGIKVQHQPLPLFRLLLC